MWGWLPGSVSGEGELAIGGKRGEEFGQERLIRAVKEGADESASNLNARLLADGKRYCDLRLQDNAILIFLAVLAAQSAP